MFRSRRQPEHAGFPGLLGLLAAVAVSAGCAQPDAAANAATATVDASRVGHYGYGTPASPETIAGWDIDIRPDGLGLPPGSGSVEDGEMLYEDQCAECHGSFGEGVGRFPVLAGGEESLTDDRPTRTVGSYWRYTSTLFDYIRRSMPFAQPHSLSDDETYAVTAYVLYLNDLVADDFVLSKDNLTTVLLPNEGNFVPDPRPDVANIRCMSDCRDAAAIQIISEVAPAVAEPTVAESTQPDGPGPGASAHSRNATYHQYCNICHDVGVAGAPKLGDADAWVSRIDRVPEMVANAINGISSESGVMPAKGGFAHLTDDEVRSAVEYMVEASR